MADPHSNAHARSVTQYALKAARSRYASVLADSDPKPLRKGDRIKDNDKRERNRILIVDSIETVPGKGPYVIAHDAYRSFRIRQSRIHSDDNPRGSGFSLVAGHVNPSAPLEARPAPPPLHQGDTLQDNSPGMDWRTLTVRAIGTDEDPLVTTVDHRGRQVTIKRSRIHLDGKARRSGFARVGVSDSTSDGNPSQGLGALTP